MGPTNIQIALFTGYPNYYPYPTETLVPYSYSYPGENSRIRIRIRTIRELSDPKGIRIRFCPERTETIRSVFIPNQDCTSNVPLFSDGSSINQMTKTYY